MKRVASVYYSNPGPVDILRMMVAPRGRLQKVMLPRTPYLISGLRIREPEALIAALFQRVHISQRGARVPVNAAPSEFNTAVMLAAMGALPPDRTVIDGNLSVIEPSLLRWRPADAGFRFLGSDQLNLKLLKVAQRVFPGRRRCDLGAVVQGLAIPWRAVDGINNGANVLNGIGHARRQG